MVNMKSPVQDTTRIWKVALGLLAATVLLGRLAGTYAPTLAFFVWLVGLSLFVATGLMALLNPHYARREERQLAAFQRGEFLVHWTYQPGEWSRFTAAEQAKADRQARWLPLAGGVVGAAGGLIFLPVIQLSGLLLVTAGSVALGWGLGRLVRRRGALKETDPAEAYIGAEIAYCGGRTIGWTGNGMAISGLELLAGDPAVLQITVRTGIKGAWSILVPHSRRLTLVYRIPVPAGREAEARQVIAALGDAAYPG